MLHGVASSLPPFWDNVLVPSSKMPDPSRQNWHTVPEYRWQTTNQFRTTSQKSQDLKQDSEIPGSQMPGFCGMKPCRLVYRYQHIGVHYYMLRAILYWNTLKMQAVSSSKTMVPMYQSTQCRIPKLQIFNTLFFSLHNAKASDTLSLNTVF
jgi:hypothetical protein